jgi:photosystem II stability/assembly factor-like uncharacterized protein
MKKIFFILIILHFSLLLANAQWIWQTSGITTPIRDIKFINRNTGWVCGDGVILKTTNAGTNWVIQTQPATDKYLYSINPVNENIVFCVGWFETILKTTDGGNNWIPIRNGPFGSGASYWTSHFLNENTGWIAGGNQKVLKTTNGCTTFDSIYLFVGYISDIYFKDSLNGFLCGDGGLTRKTTNGGYNWFTTNIQLHGNLYNFYKVSFVNNQYGWLIGNGNPVYRTTDFGMNWDSIGYVTGSNEIYFVNFSSILTGWAGGTYGRMFKTTNGGYNWTMENTSSFTGYIRESFFYNDSIGWIVGGGGRIQYTTSSGQVMKITNSNKQIANDFRLYQNYPNPFNPNSKIKYRISEDKFVTLKAYDVLGREIETLVNEKNKAGTYEVNFNGEYLPTGVYFYSIFVDGVMIETKIMMLIK